MTNNGLWNRIKTLESQMALAFAKDAQIVGNFFQQGGNAFGATAVLGTTDANGINFITSGASPRMAISAAGVLSSGFTGASALTSVGNLTVTSAGAMVVSSSTGTVSITSTTGMTITGGGASTFSTAAGALTITSAAAATWSTGAGALTLVGAARINFQPGADSTSAFQFQNAAATLPSPLVIDSTNGVSTFTSSVNGQPGIRCVGGGATPSQSALIVSFTNAPAATTFIANFVNQANVATANGLLIQAGQNTFSAVSDMIRFTRPDATTIGTVQQNATGTVAYNTSSDARLKENIRDTQRGLDVVRRIQVRDFTAVGDSRVQQGFVAQELSTIYPDAVVQGGKNAKSEPWQIGYGHMTPLLCRAIQQLADKVDELEKKLAA